MIRRGLIATVFSAALALSACVTGASSDDAPAGFSPIPISEFPGELGGGFPAAERVEEGRADVGAPAPNFAFMLEDGRGADLASLHGKPVVLNFWATWCGPCRAEMPGLVALHENNADVVVLEVNVGEEQAAVKEFAAEFGMTMIVVLDQADSVRRAYSVRNMPTTVFIRADGVIGARWPGVLVGEQLADFVERVTIQ